MRISIFASLLCVALIAGCTSTDQPGNTEPVSPDPDAQTGYPEDPDLGPPSGEEPPSMEEPASAAEDTPGELTDDPYGPITNDTGSDTPMEDAPVDGSVADDIAGSFEDPTPEYEPSPEAQADSFVEPTTPSDDTSTDKMQVTRYVNAILLNVRAKPTHRSPIVRRLYGGAKINVEVHGAYAKIQDGQWVRTRYLSSKPTKKITAKDVEAAWRKSRYKDTWKP